MRSCFYPLLILTTSASLAVACTTETRVIEAGAPTSDVAPASPEDADDASAAPSSTEGDDAATDDQGEARDGGPDGDAPATPGSLAPPSTLEAGDRATCVVNAQGAVRCWGRGTYGQLGDGLEIDSPTPVTVTGLTSGATSVSVGRMHACAVTTSGAVKCWGSNESGQLGVGSGVRRSLVPTQVVGLASGIARVSAGHVFSCALTTSGGVKCWGESRRGALGNGSVAPVAGPVDVIGLTRGVVAIATGFEHACALTTSGGVKCWGGGSDGAVAADVPGLTRGVKAIATGQATGCAIRADDTVACWRSFRPYAPTAVPGATSAALISADYTHSCIVTRGGGVKCWGGNLYGQLGNGTKSGGPEAADVIGLASGVVAVSCGDWHTCARRSGGEILCWGMNTEGQLGMGSIEAESALPVSIAGL